MPLSVKDLHPCAIGERTYLFRTPTVLDPAKARRTLTRQRVRRPALAEFRVAALRGIEELAKTAGEAEEGERQQALLEEWYTLLAPVNEDDIDEPDPLKRGTQLVQRETERRTRLAALYPDTAAIEATLERHWPPYAELKADRDYWDDVSRIEVVRLLLTEIDGEPQPIDGDGLLEDRAYQAIPAAHRVALASFAFGLLAPDEAQRKN